MTRTNIPDDLSTRRLLWYSLLVAILLYNLVAYLIIGGEESRGISKIWMMALGIVAILSGCAALTLRSLLTKGFYKNVKNLSTRTRDLIIWALVETICLCGFVLSLMANDIRYVIYFSIPALIFFIATPPLGDPKNKPGSKE